MLIVPELRCIIIQPPRTGSTSLRDAILKQYPRAFAPYRHMERDGIPTGYDAYDVIGMVRHPVDRLMSLYAYMRNFRSSSGKQTNEWAARMASDTDRSFAEWLEGSREPFTDPVDLDGSFQPYYAVRNMGPITRRSQKLWHRPDMGPLELLRLEDQPGVEDRLGISLSHLNASQPAEVQLCASAQAFIETHHGWDLSLYR